VTTFVAGLAVVGVDAQKAAAPDVLKFARD